MWANKLPLAVSNQKRASVASALIQMIPLFPGVKCFCLILSLSECWWEEIIFLLHKRACTGEQTEHSPSLLSLHCQKKKKIRFFLLTSSLLRTCIFNHGLRPALSAALRAVFTLCSRASHLYSMCVLACH